MCITVSHTSSNQNYTCLKWWIRFSRCKEHFCCFLVEPAWLCTKSKRDWERSSVFPFLGSEVSPTGSEGWDEHLLESKSPNPPQELGDESKFWSFFFLCKFNFTPGLFSELHDINPSLGSNNVCICASLGTQAYLYVLQKVCGHASPLGAIEILHSSMLTCVCARVCWLASPMCALSSTINNQTPRPRAHLGDACQHTLKDLEHTRVMQVSILHKL